MNETEEKVMGGGSGGGSGGDNEDDIGVRMLNGNLKPTTFRCWYEVKDVQDT